SRGVISVDFIFSSGRLIMASVSLRIDVIKSIQAPFRFHKFPISSGIKLVPVPCFFPSIDLKFFADQQIAGN
ncbi:MAG: hypothetical protein ACXW0M_12785, partial [Methylosarcina sp.]